jgi:hypothetical protein
MILTEKEKKIAIETIKSKLSNTNLKLDNYESMAVNLLNIYNWDVREISKYAI